MSGFVGNGADVECGQANPLVSIGTHFTKDVSLHEVSHSMAGTAFSLSQRPDVLPAPATFKMDSLLRELQNTTDHSQLEKNQLIENEREWSKEYLEREQKLHAQGAAWIQEYSSNHLNQAWEPSGPAQLYNLATATSSHPIPVYQDHSHQSAQTLEKARDLLDDSRWVTEFSTNEVDDMLELRATARELLNTVQDLDLKATEFMSYVEQLSGPLEDNKETDKAEKWVAEYANDPERYFGEDVKDDFWGNMQEEWDRLAREEGDSHPWLSGTSTLDQKKYQFNEWNPFKDKADALSEGKMRLQEGDIPSAVLAFEAAVQQEPDSSEGWLLLGTTQAQNEQDPLAISALKRCLELDSNNLVALMALAASQTNESLNLQAANSLKKWLKTNPKYSHLLPPTEPDEVSSVPHVSSILPRKDLENIQRAFMQAARLNPVNNVDPDVQSGLGVLFNLSNDYEKAADCFKAAVNANPNDSLLWNRLGATLANGGKSAEATGSYRKALELSPGFIRTRFNLGISCVNLGAYREAAEHFLSALNQQAAGKRIYSENANSSVMSDSIWSSMRMVLHLINRSELASAIDTRDLPRLNKEFLPDSQQH